MAKDLTSGRDRVHNQMDSRVVIAIHSGLALTVVVVLLCFMPINFLSPSYDGPNISLRAWFSLNMSAINETKQTVSSGATQREVVFVREWEMPRVREANEDEKVGEVAFGESARRFLPFGIGSLTFLFSHFGSYRTGPKSFALVGLGPKALHISWSKPGFRCSWAAPPSPPSGNIQTGETNATVTEGRIMVNGTATNYYVPDEEFSNQDDYVTLVVHCTFESPVGVDGRGGELRVTAEHGWLPKESGLESVVFVGLVEQAGQYNESSFDAPFRYEYLYCGSPLYGSLSPHRMREWLAYHMRIFGQSSHFILYDVGGIGVEVWKVLEPWVKLGRVTIMNVRQQVRYNAYLFNQFLFANDCLMQAKTLAKWAFFFDVDEYLHLSQAPLLEQSFHEVMAEMANRGRNATRVQLQQRPMSPKHCLKNDSNPAYHSEWGIEKLVYRRFERNFSGVYTHWHDNKSAIQAKYVLSMGIHWAVSVEVPPGLTPEDTITHLDYYSEWCGNCVVDKLHYYHYHGTISNDGDLCEEFLDSLNTTIDFDGANYEYDDSMSVLAFLAKDFELQTIGYAIFNETKLR